MGIQIAQNPKTGETAVLVGDQWQKADQIAQNDKGERAYLVGGKWLTSEGTANLPTAPQRGAGEELARQLGLTVRAGAKGVVAVPAMVGDALGLNSSGSVDRLLDYIGLPKPENATERVAQDIAGAMAGGGVQGAVAAAARPAGMVGQGIANALAANQGTQAAAAAAGAGAAGVTREMGGGPVVQMAAGLAGGVAVPMAGQMVANAVPNMVARSIRKSDATPFAQEGERLAQSTGIDLPLGARTGNKAVLTLENTARQYPLTADRVQSVDMKIANQAISRVNELADRISTAKTDPESLGSRIEQTIRGAAEQLDKVRDSNAARDYGAVRQLAGNEPVIRYQNLTEELGKIISEFENVVGSDAQKIVAQAKAALARTTEKTASTRIGIGQSATGEGASIGPAASDITEAMKSRSFYGKAAKGAANVFEDLAPNMNRTIGARLFAAINRDFDAAAENTGGALRAALDKANANYKASTQSLEYLQKSALGKMVGEELADAAVSGKTVSTTAGEAIVGKIASLHPSTRRTAVQIIQQWNPTLAQDLKASVLRDALDQATAIPPSAKGASQVPISFNRFAAAIGSQKVGFDKNLESYGFNAKEIADIKDTAVAMMRAGDRTGFNFSNTSVQHEAMDLAQTIGEAGASVASGGYLGAARAIGGKVLTIAGKTVGLNKVVDAMSTDQGRAALRTISKPQASPQAVIAAFETINKPDERRN